MVQAGEHFDGESSLKFGANAGFGIGETGFVNASIEVIDNDALSRGLQRPDAQALEDQGIPVGTDAPFGDAPLVQSWGRPETEGVRFYLNSGFDISDTSQLYARFSLADTDGRYRFFYRNPDHSSLTQHRLTATWACRVDIRRTWTGRRTTHRLSWESVASSIAVCLTTSATTSARANWITS